jgi:K+ transporter
MVRPFIIHKFIESFAWVFATKTAKINALFLRAPSELTLPYIIIDIVTSAAAAIRRPTRTAI